MKEPTINNIHGLSDVLFVKNARQSVNKLTKKGVTIKRVEFLYGPFIQLNNITFNIAILYRTFISN